MLIGEGTDIGKIRMQAIKEGTKTLRLSGAQKVGSGNTTIQEILRVAPISGTQ
jgi:general secretion pathway protein E